MFLLGRIVKTSHIKSPKDYLEETTKNSPDGTHIVIKSDNNGKTIHYICYSYNLKKVISFISNLGVESSVYGKLHEAWWRDNYGNVHVSF